MAMISIENLSFGYDGSYENVFEDVSLRLDTSWRLGFTGRNGRGKTTFLRLLMGHYEYAGRIVSPVEFDYFPFETGDKTRTAAALLAPLLAESEGWEIYRELSLLALSDTVLDRPFETLSNGEQTKLLLSALFSRENRFLLIDEPTNHLDMEARALVSDYLRSKSGFLLVSHDREFLDGCVDHILALNRANIEVQRGDFSSWLRNKELADSFELAENERLKKDVKRLSAAAARTAAWSDKVEKSKHQPLDSGLSPDRGHIGHKAAKLMKRAKGIETRQTAAADAKSALLKNLDTAEPLFLRPLRHHAARLIELRDVAISYGDRPVCEGLRFSLAAGERVALHGRNGSGKTSLLKLLLGQDIPHSGTVFIASGLRFSYVSQDTSRLCGNLRSFAEHSGLDESLFKAILRKLDFSRPQLERNMEDFSEGQKKKVLLAKSLCEEAHVYIWDEPLNYVDVLSRMQIEVLIKQSSPTMLFVEHDRAFETSIATRVIDL